MWIAHWTNGSQWMGGQGCFDTVAHSLILSLSHPLPHPPSPSPYSHTFILFLFVNISFRLREYSGVIVASFVKPSSKQYQLLVDAQERLRRMRCANKFVFVPENSFHFNLMEIAYDQVRDPLHWPSIVSIDVPFEELCKQMQTRWKQRKTSSSLGRFNLKYVPSLLKRQVTPGLQSITLLVSCSSFELCCLR